MRPRGNRRKKWNETGKENERVEKVPEMLLGCEVWWKGRKVEGFVVWQPEPLRQRKEVEWPLFCCYDQKKTKTRWGKLTIPLCMQKLVAIYPNRLIYVLKIGWLRWYPLVSLGNCFYSVVKFNENSTCACKIPCGCHLAWVGPCYYYLCRMPWYGSDPLGNMFLAQ